MTEDRDRARRIVATRPGAIEPEPGQPHESVDETFAEAERVEDTVPYLPPLASYRIQALWGDVRQGVPTIFPEDAAELDETEE